MKASRQRVLTRKPARLVRYREPLLWIGNRRGAEKCEGSGALMSMRTTPVHDFKANHLNY
jgi:hypothetical protein